MTKESSKRQELQESVAITLPGSDFQPSKADMEWDTTCRASPADHTLDPI